MEWRPEATEALRRVPVFVRPLVRRKVEEFARQQGAQQVSAELLSCAREQLAPPGKGGGMEPDPAEIERLERDALAVQEGKYRHRCYEVRPCAGAVGCPRALVPVGEIADDLAAEIERSGFPRFLLDGRAGRPILSHHRLKVAVSGCPNACSQPQIHDFGAIGRVDVGISPELCNDCGECVRACQEEAITVGDQGPVIDRARCIGCADCVRVCPTEALAVDRAGLRLLAGGRLGRHPQLAREIADNVDAEEATHSLGRILETLIRVGEPGQRVASIMDRVEEVAGATPARPRR